MKLTKSQQDQRLSHPYSVEVQFLKLCSSLPMMIIGFFQACICKIRYQVSGQVTGGPFVGCLRVRGGDLKDYN